MFWQALTLIFFIYYMLVAIRSNQEYNRDVLIRLNQAADRVESVDSSYSQYRQYLREEKFMEEWQATFKTGDIIRGLRFDKEIHQVLIPFLGLNEKGLFVVQFIEKTGWLKGSYKEANWSQNFPDKRTFSFPNPVLAGEEMRQVLKASLPLPFQGAIYSIVIFGEDAYLTDIKGQNSEVLVTTQEKYAEDMARFLKKLPERYGQRERAMLQQFFSFWQNAGGGNHGHHHHHHHGE